VHAPGEFDVGAARAWYARLARACGASVHIGIHTCAGVDAALAELDVDLWSIDASGGLAADAARLLARHLRRGWVAWGIVASRRHDVVTADAALGLWRQACDALAMDPHVVAARSWITPACGLAGLAPEAGIERLRIAHQVARRIERGEPAGA
jgi:methionine synthase II (cobalamin-independent)